RAPAVQRVSRAVQSGHARLFSQAPAVTVMTVLGPTEGDKLGVTLMHEHLLIDVSYKWQQPIEVTARALAEQPITLANLGYLAGNIGAVKATYRLYDVETATAEALAFRRDGGSTIVDVSPVGIG